MIVPTIYYICSLFLHIVKVLQLCRHCRISQNATKAELASQEAQQNNADRPSAGLKCT